MLIEGGYDPYSEKNISITPVFLQKDLKSLEILLDHCFINNIQNVDIAYETLLFKPCINPKIIDLFDVNNDNMSHCNVLGNTPLHVQHDPQNIVKLLRCGANPNIRNNDGNTAIQVAENVYNQLGIAKWEGNIERREELLSIFANIIELLEDNIRLSRTQKASQQLQASRLPIDYESSMRIGKYLSRMPLHNPDVSRKIKEEETQEEERQHKEIADYLNTLAQYGGKKKRKKSKKKLKKKKNK